jgi:hypothetical protein
VKTLYRLDPQDRMSGTYTVVTGYEAPTPPGETGRYVMFKSNRTQATSPDNRWVIDKDRGGFDAWRDTIAEVVQPLIDGEIAAHEARLAKLKSLIPELPKENPDDVTAPGRSEGQAETQAVEAPPAAGPEGQPGQGQG